MNDKSAQVNNQGKVPKGPQNASKGSFSPSEIEITSANTFAEVLDYDQKGARILFACEKGQFLALTEDEIRQLSPFTRTVYGAMKAQNKVMEAEDPEWDRVKKEFKVGATMGSARARMKVDGVRPDMETRYFRPDNMTKAESRGYRPVKVGSVKVAGSHQGHISIKAHGEDELVLMERPKSFRDEFEKNRQARKKARREAEKQEYSAEAQKYGYRALRDAEVARGSYKDVE